MRDQKALFTLRTKSFPNVIGRRSVAVNASGVLVPLAPAR